jgi:hypothetical protein
LTIFDRDYCVITAADTVALLHELPQLELRVDPVLCPGNCNTVALNFTGQGPFTADYDLSLGGLATSNTRLAVQGVDTSFQLCWGDFPVDSLILEGNEVSDAFCRLELDTSLTIRRLRIDTNFIRTEICRGDSLEVNGLSFDENNPRDTLVLAGQARGGCDSVIVVDLRFAEAVVDTFQRSICLDEQFTINGTVYGATNLRGTELFAGQSSRGCDSTLYIELSLLNPDTGRVERTLCRGEQLQIGNEVFDETNSAGLAILPGQARSGCDSLVRVELSFVDSIQVDYRPQLCFGEIIEINGRMYGPNNPRGREVFTARGGCDSIVIVNLDFYPENRSFLIDTLCAGDSLVFNGRVYNERRLTGTEVLPGAGRNGCDSLIEVIINYTIPALAGKTTGPHPQSNRNRCARHSAGWPDPADGQNKRPGPPQTGYPLHKCGR